MTQLLLGSVVFAPPHSGAATSRAAAEAIEPCAETLRGKLLAILREHPEGLTDEQMQELSGLDGSTQRPRRQELEKLNLCHKTIGTRKTKSGRAALIWKA